MTAFGSLLHGFGVALTWQHLAYALGGAFIGTAVGVLPGIGPAMTVALLLPVTYSVAPTAALILLAGIYYGAMYGGSTTSILLNVPGESATVVTTIEGYEMTKRGRAGAALATAAIGSFVAGVLGTLGLALAGPSAANLALRLGPADQFAIIVLAFALVTSVMGESQLKAVTSLLLGLAIGMVGIDARSGEARFTFGIPELLDGVDVVLVAVAFLAVSEVLFTAWTGAAVVADPVRGATRAGMTRDDWRRSWPAWLRGTAIGFPFGAIPAGGAELPTVISYAVEKRLAKHDEFGRGAIEGVAGPEAANNASAAGTLVPLLGLGIPTTATATVLLAAFQQYGLQPGPLLFRNSPDLVWGLLASLLIGNAMLLVLNLPLVGMWARLATIKPAWLNAGILVLATVGAWSQHHSVVDLALLFALGIVGALLRLGEFPIVPALVGAMLGPLGEQHFARAMSIANGSVRGALMRPVSATLLILAMAIVVGAWWRMRRKGTGGIAGDVGFQSIS